MNYATLGRPRLLTQAEIDWVLDWHERRMTLKQVARRLGVSPGTIAQLIRTRGTHYKQAPPERRAAAKTARRARHAQLRAGGYL